MQLAAGKMNVSLLVARKVNHILSSSKISMESKKRKKRNKNNTRNKSNNYEMKNN